MRLNRVTLEKKTSLDPPDMFFTRLRLLPAFWHDVHVCIFFCKSPGTKDNSVISGRTSHDIPAREMPLIARTEGLKHKTSSRDSGHGHKICYLLFSESGKTRPRSFVFQTGLFFGYVACEVCGPPSAPRSGYTDTKTGTAKRDIQHLTSTTKSPTYSTFQDRKLTDIPPDQNQRLYHTSRHTTSATFLLAWMVSVRRCPTNFQNERQINNEEDRTDWEN